MTVFISTSYFSLKESLGVKLLRKYWWKNSIIQILKYRGVTFIIVTIGHGKANAAMTTTYLIEKYTNITNIINIDLALSSNEKIKTGDATISTKFIYRDVDQTVFQDLKYGQIVDESETFQFDGRLAQKITNLKLNLLEAVIGTGDMQIYNSKQFKELIEKYGNSIDVIDEEAGALAQVLKKTEINFLSLKVIYNNALSPWDNDPKHRYKMYEITNIFKYLIKRVLNFLSSTFEYILPKLNNDIIETLSSIIESHHDNWATRIKSDTVKVQAIANNSVILSDKHNKDNWKVDFYRLKNEPIVIEKNSDIEAAKMILGVDEWRYAPSNWVEKLPIIDELHMNNEELLLNKLITTAKKISKEYEMKILTNEFAIITRRCQNILSKPTNTNVSEKNNSNKSEKESKKTEEKQQPKIDASKVKHALILYCDANISFYISENSSHELIEDHKLGVTILKNEIIKLLNNSFKDIEMQYDKINLYINVKALYNTKICLFFNAENSVGKIINFGKVSSSMQKDYTVVDNMFEHHKSIDIGSFKTSIKIKPC